MARLLLIVLAAAAPAGIAAGSVLPGFVGDAAARINGKSLRCGVQFLMNDCAPPNLRNTSAAAKDLGVATCSSTGTGFAYTNDNATLTMMANAPWNALVPLDPTLVLGASVANLVYAAGMANLNFTLFGARVPPNIMTDSDSTKHYVYMQNQMGLDCSAYAVTQQAPRKPYMRFTTPYLPYGFQAAGPRPVLVNIKLVDQMFFILTAFAPEVWGLTIGSLAVTSYLVTMMERHHGRGDFHSHKKDGLAAQLSHAAYLAALGLSEHDFYTAKTPAGRIYTALKALCLFLLMAFYDAKLVAFLSIANKPVQPIQSLGDMIDLGVVPCVRNHGNTINYLKNYHPFLKAAFNTSFPNNTYIYANLPAALKAMTTGACAGVVAVDLELLYELGPADPTGTLCDYQLVGPKFGVEYFYSHSFTLSTTTWSQSDLNDLSTLMTYYSDLGAYEDQVQTFFYGGNRPACAAKDKKQASSNIRHPAQTTALLQLSGVLIVLATGAGVSFVLWFLRRVYKFFFRRGGIRRIRRGLRRLLRRFQRTFASGSNSSRRIAPDGALASSTTNASSASTSFAGTEDDSDDGDDIDTMFSDAEQTFMDARDRIAQLRHIMENMADTLEAKNAELASAVAKQASKMGPDGRVGAQVAPISAGSDV